MSRAPLVVALASLLVAACVVGDPTTTPPGQGDDGDGVDAGPIGRDGGGGGDGGGANNECEDVVSPAPDGHHNPGTTCIASGCHDGNTAGAPRFTVAGTLYTSKAGTTPRAGAHIIIPTGGGNPVKLTVAANGNFWSATPATLNTRPKASGCPNLVQMPSSTTSGNCNSAGCHGVGARIALPP
jgi:hypothetical protein